MHNPWVLASTMGVIAFGTIFGLYLSQSGYANRSTANTNANRPDAVDQTILTPTPTATPTATPAVQRVYSAAPPLSIDPKKQYTATIKTSKGDFTVQLFPQDAPQTVNNFVFLAEHHFYDGLKFDRVVPDFVVQGGDPTGQGKGDPGYTLPDEINGHKNDPGAVAMANPGPNQNGSTFFVDLVSNASLDGRYTVFGHVLSGMDVVKAIGQTRRDPENVNAPAVTIDSVSVSPQ